MQDVPYHQYSMCSNTVTLQHKVRYFSTIVAFHGAVNGLNVSAHTNGSKFGAGNVLQ